MADYYIAAASKDGVTVDSHFGHADTYQIIAVDAGKHEWKVERVLEVHFPGEENTGDTVCWGCSEEKVEYVAEQLKDCRYILVQKIGPRPHKILQRHELDCMETDLDISQAVKKIIEYNGRRRDGKPG